MFKKWPDINIQGATGTGAGTGTPTTRIASLNKAFGSPSTLFNNMNNSQRGIVRKPVKKSAKSTNDEQDLKKWIVSSSTAVGAQKVFKVGKDRRKFLHDLCDQLSLDTPGLQLDHHSDNNSTG